MSSRNTLWPINKQENAFLLAFQREVTCYHSLNTVLYARFEVMITSIQSMVLHHKIV